MLCTTIIPTINRPSLERAVKSALEQNLDDHLHEILIYNNSRQPLPDVDWLKSSKVTVINSYSNLIDAMNKGANLASGTYINFLDDDDYLLPNALKALLDKAMLTGCNWIYGAYNLVDDDGNFISVVPSEARGNLLALFVGGENLHFAASLIRRDAYLKAGGMDPRILVWGDLDLCCQMALLGNFDGISQSVAIVRLSGGSKSSFDYSNLAQDYRRIRDKVFNSQGALARIQHSVQGDVFLRGHTCRAYLFSAVLNFLDGHIVVASARVISLLRLAGLYSVLPVFWRGVFFRTWWHAVEKKKQKEHFTKYQPSSHPK
ncbi:MAG: glycosyltransferase [Caldilinea sp. CFX5]|nr:glycosyltransferase [Caldilinea sp. CFX5]